MAGREVRFGLGRLWLGEVPDRFKYDAGEILECRLALTRNLDNIILTEPRCVGMKFLQLTNCARYGVLGAEFTPGDANDLTIRVMLPSEEHWKGDNLVGLTRPHGEIVLDEAKLQAQGVNFLGSGILEFNRAAEHRTDSSFPIVFHYLVRAIIALLNPVVDGMIDEEVESMVKKAIWSENS